jgi:hypothetical protein
MKHVLHGHKAAAFAVLAVVSASAAILLAAERGAQRQGPKGPAAKAAGKPWYVIPRKESAALRYRCTWTGSQRVQGQTGEALFSARFALWSPGENRLSLRLLSVNGFMKRGGKKRKLDCRGMRERVWTMAFSGFGQKAFECEPGADCPEDIALLLGAVCGEALPLVFVPIPRDQKLEAGQSWGPEPPEDALDSFDNEPRCRRWTVAEVGPSLPGTRQVRLASGTRDATNANGVVGRASRNRDVRYDPVVRRTRSAREVYRYEWKIGAGGRATTYSFRDVIVTELPQGR